MEKRKQIVKKSLFTIVFLLLLSIIFSNHSYAEFEIEDIENSHYTKEYQEYLKLSDEEKAKLNVIPPKYAQSLHDYMDTHKNAFESVRGDLPTAYNLRDHINIPIEDQGSDGLCWAFSSLTSVETNLALRNITVDLSERHLDYLTSKEFWNKIGSNPGFYRTLGSGGNFDMFTQYTSSYLGPVNESQVPYYRYYNENEYSMLKSLSPALYVNETVQLPSIFSYEKSNNTYTEDDLNYHRNLVKQHIMENGSLYIDIYANSITPYNGRFVINNQAASAIQDHAISLIGWDDNFSVDNFPYNIRPKKNGAYIAQNQWGESQTIIYISYEDLYIDDFMYGVKSCSFDAPEYEQIQFNDRTFYNQIKQDIYGNALQSYDYTNMTLTVAKAYLDRITHLSIESVRDLKGIEHFSNVSSLIISSSIVADYSQLKNLPCLGELYLSSTHLSDMGYGLKDLHITELDIYGSSTNIKMANIANIQSLKRIYLTLYDIGQNYTFDFSSMTGLIDLSIGKNNFTTSDAGYVVNITGIPSNLIRLSLDNVNIDVNIIKNLSKLENIYLSDIPVSNLEFLPNNLPNISNIGLYNTKVSNIDAIERCLSSNNFVSLMIFDDGYQEIIDITNLSKNDMLFNKVTIDTDRVLYCEYEVSESGYANNEFKLRLSDYLRLHGIIHKYGMKDDDYYNNEVESDNCKPIYYSDNANAIEYLNLYTNDKPGLNEATMEFWHKYVYANYKSCSLKLVVKYNVIDSSGSLNNYNVKYATHIQNIGWENIKYASWKKDGQMSGTSGLSYRLEGIKIKLSPDIDGGIEYVTHIQNIGWEDIKYGSWKKDGEMSGTSGQSLRLEAIKIRLTGNAAEQYDVYYQVHAQNIGWMDWAKNGESAGTAGFGFRLEGIQIVLVPKGSEAPGLTVEPYREYGKSPRVVYSTHVQNIGDQPFVANGAIAGTSGQSLRLESIRINLENLPGGIEYVTHVQILGWEDKNGEEWKKNGERSGTAGKSYRLEAIKIRLTGPASEKYDIYYRVHAQNIGWMGWAKNGEESGTEGHSFRLEGIQIVLVKKGQNPPAYNPPANKAIRFYN